LATLLATKLIAFHVQDERSIQALDWTKRASGPILDDGVAEWILWQHAPDTFKL